ncbi:MAG: PAS domain S-box protein, partial [Methanothermobacter sp.]
MVSEHKKFKNKKKTSSEKSSYFIETLEFSPEKIQTPVEQQKASNTILKEQDEQVQLFIDNAPAAIAMFDNEMNYISASMRWIEDYNLKEQEIRGKSHYDIFPEVTDELKEVHQRCIHGAVEQGEGKFIRMNGDVQWIKWEVQPWYLP